jgi:hypothetical protein
MEAIAVTLARDGGDLKGLGLDFIMGFRLDPPSGRLFYANPVGWLEPS